MDSCSYGHPSCVVFHIRLSQLLAIPVVQFANGKASEVGASKGLSILLILIYPYYLFQANWVDDRDGPIRNIQGHASETFPGKDTVDKVGKCAKICIAEFDKS